MEKWKIPKIGMKKDKLILCFLVGVLLLVAALPIKKETSGVDLAEHDSEVISDYGDTLGHQLEDVLTRIEGIGEVHAMVTLEPLVDERESPEIRGVIVVAESGDDPIEILKIQETVMTLFQIDAHRIKVMKLKYS